MNQKLHTMAGRLEGWGLLLLLFSALRCDSGLSHWLLPALAGTALCLVGMTLSWLCSDAGLAFRRRIWRKPAPSSPVPREKIIPFPRAG